MSLRWRRLGAARAPRPLLNFQPVPEPKQGKSRIHLDAAPARAETPGTHATGERYEHDKGTVVILNHPEDTELRVVAYRTAPAPC